MNHRLLQEQRVTPKNSLLSSVAATLRVGTWRVSNELLRMAITQQAKLGLLLVVDYYLFSMIKSQGLTVWNQPVTYHSGQIITTSRRDLTIDDD